MFVIAAAPIALGSFVAAAFALALYALIVVRLRGEERYLAEHLEGYADYMTKTRYRLVPGVY